MNHPTRSAIQAAIKALRECRELIQTDRTSLADSEMDPVTNTVPTDAKEMLDEYDSTLAHAEDAVQLLTSALSHPDPEPEAVQVPQGWRLVPEVPTPDMLAAARVNRAYESCTDKQVWAAMLAAAPQPPAQADQADCIRVDALRALSYGAGLTAGWNFCASDDVTGFESAQRQGAEALRVLKATNQPPAQAEARGDEPELGSHEVNEAAWAFVEAMPHSLPGPAWNNVKPAVRSAICKYLKLTRPAPAAPQAGEAERLEALAKRNILDAIRDAYDLGYNDARNAKAVPGDSAPGYHGRDVEVDHGGALFNTLQRRWLESQPMSREANG